MKYFCDQIKTNEIFLPQTYWNYNISFTCFKEIRFVQQNKHSYCFSSLSTIYIREEKYTTTPILIGRGSQTFLVRQLCSYSENWVLGAVDKVLWWENVWNNFGMNNIQRIKRKCHFVNNTSMIKCGQQLIALVHTEYITLPALKKFWSRIVTIANYWTSDTLFQKTFSFSTLFNRWETLTDQNNAVWRQNNTVGNIFRDMFG